MDPVIQAVATRPPEQRPGASNKLTNTEWFGQVVVGTAFQPDNLVGFVATGREHQNRHILVQSAVPNSPAKRQAVDARNHDVEHQQVKGLGFYPRKRVPAIPECVACVAFETQVQTNEVTAIWFVLNDQDPGRER
jgi:hypothetical protein